MPLRKKAVSLRLSVTDVKRIKRVAQRLGVRDSDVVRYAIKAMLLKLSPLTDSDLQGRALMPLFLEWGADLVQNFDLDARKLEAILNEGASARQAVSIEDLHLLAMTGVAAESRMPEATNGASPAGSVERRSNPTRRYLYDKYLYRNSGDSGS